MARFRNLVYQATWMGLGTSLLIALAALRVETSTPDALCPTEQAVRQAVEARVGEVRGGDYLVTYRVVRGSAEGSNVIELELRGEDGELLVTRALPLSELACADADVAIALVLERYFEQLTMVPSESLEQSGSARREASGVSTKVAETAGKKEPSDRTKEDKGAPLPTRKADEGADSSKPALRWGLLLEAGVNFEPRPYLGLDLSYALTPLLDLSLGAIVPLASTEQEVDGLPDLTIYTPTAVAALEFRHGSSLWTWSGGPMVICSVQWVRFGDGDEMVPGTSSTQMRAIGGLGGQGSVELALSRRIVLQLGVRLAPQFPPLRNFTIRESDGSETVLDVQSSAFFASVAWGMKAIF